MTTFIVLLMFSIVVLFLILFVLPNYIGLTDVEQTKVDIEPVKPEVPVFVSTTTITTMKPKRKPTVKAKAKPKAKVVSAKNPIKRKK
jgi:hypothetical protein